MVWQVRENCDSNDHEQQKNSSNQDNTDGPDPNKRNIENVEKKISSASSKLEVESRSSRGSSSSKSVDLGPTPGSGIVTADISEASDSESCSNKQMPSIGVEMTESMTTSSLMQFNRDIESMLEHGALRAAMNSKETSEEPSSSIEEPREDFTQNIQ